MKYKVKKYTTIERLVRRNCFNRAYTSYFLVNYLLLGYVTISIKKWSLGVYIQYCKKDSLHYRHPIEVNCKDIHKLTRNRYFNNSVRVYHD